MRFILLLILSFPVCAQSVFEQHVQSVSRSMASFYMYELNEGDKQYWLEFIAHRDLATKMAMQLTEESKMVFYPAWMKLVDMLKFVEVRGQGLSLDEYVRLQFRQYLTQIFLELEKQPDYVNKLDRVYTYSSVITGRAMDLASSHYGPQGLTEDDLRLNPQNISNNIQGMISDLLLDEKIDVDKSQLRKLQSRIRFVESSLVNYDQTIPYLLLYSNIEKIAKLKGDVLQLGRL